MTNNTQYEENKKEIVSFVRDYLERRKWQIENNFMIMLPFEAITSAYDNVEQTAFYQQLDEINRAATGLMDNDAEGWNRSVTYEGIQDLCEQLFCPPGLGSAYEIPNSFWNDTVFGRMVRDAYLWCAEDELVTATEAARLCGKTVQAINNFMAAGRLTVYSDEGQRHRPGGRLVSKNEVERLCNGCPMKQEKRIQSSIHPTSAWDRGSAANCLAIDRPPPAVIKSSLAAEWEAELRLTVGGRRGSVFFVS